MKQKNLSDAVLINNMAQQLGISPLDIFMNWIQTGEVTNITISIAYKNGDVIKTDLIKQPSQFKETRDIPMVLETKENNSEAESNSVPFCTEDSNDTEIKPETDSADILSLSQVTSFTKGTIAVKPSQQRNITIGAYVYTTGDILPDHNALPGVKIRGIILSHSTDKITLIKHIGTDFTALEAIGKAKDGWRFLTFHECETLAQYKERLNIKLAELRRKQIDGSIMLLYKDEKENQLYGFNISTRKVHKTLSGASVLQDRFFVVYMAKDLKIV